MADERPAFTLETDAPKVAELPIAAWAAACAGLGLASGGILAGSVQGLADRSPDGALAIQGIAAAAAFALLALPVGREAERGVHLAGRLAVLGPLAAAALWFLPTPLAGSPASLAPLGLAAPAAMMTALKPDAALTPRVKGEGASSRWLGQGALPSALLFAGFGIGFAAPGVAAVGFAMTAVGGLLLLFGSSFPPAPPPSSMPEAASRWPTLLHMTPMMRHAATAEMALAFALAASAAALAASPPIFAPTAEGGAALVLGGIVGALLWRAWAPRTDPRLGRGAILTAAYLAAALAPLALSASGGAGSAAAFFAALLAAFALASAPQRHALVYDLAPSRSRARTALDEHGLKMLAAAAGALAFEVVESAAPGLALALVSAVGLVAVALFAPTLGALGRRAH